MALYNDKLIFHNQFNSEQFKIWFENTTNIKSSTKSQYASTISRFLIYIDKLSILEINKSIIISFRNSPSGLKNQSKLKPSVKRARINYLTNFLVFIDNKFPDETKWDFRIEELPSFAPTQEDINNTQENAEALTFNDLVRIYRKFDTQIKRNKEWLKAFVIFRLMLNYNLDKYDISNINSSTYDTNTGFYKKHKTKIKIQFDQELVSILTEEGLDFLSYQADTLYSKLDVIGTYLGKKVTQEVIRETKKRFQIQCPRCGNFYDNDSKNFGIAKIDILNVNGILVCKTCLENL